MARAVVLKHVQWTHRESLFKHRLPSPTPEFDLVGPRMVNIFPGDADASVPGTCSKALKTTALEEHPADNDGGITQFEFNQSVSLCTGSSTLPDLKLFLSIQNGLGEETH